MIDWSVSGQPVFLRRVQVLLRQSSRRLWQPGCDRRLVCGVPPLRGRYVAQDVAQPVGSALHEARQTAGLEDRGQLL